MTQLPEWCEQIAGEDLQEKYAPSWAVIFSVSIDRNSIRDDYVTLQNKLHLEKVQNRAPKMVWREGSELHLTNLSSLLAVDPEEIIEGWRKGIESAKEYKHTDKGAICVFGTVTSLFESLHIHSMTSDALGMNWTDDITVINTGLEERLGDK